MYLMFYKKNVGLTFYLDLWPIISRNKYFNKKKKKTEYFLKIAHFTQNEFWSTIF